jgi:hypothetical protein
VSVNKSNSSTVQARVGEGAGKRKKKGHDKQRYGSTGTTLQYMTTYQKLNTKGTLWSSGTYDMSK